MSLNSYDNVLSDSASGCDHNFRFRPNDGSVPRFMISSEEEEEECEDIVVQLPKWAPPRQPRQHRSRSYPRRWNTTSGGLRRAVGKLSATGRLLGRRSVPSSSSSWDGRRAFEQALLFAAVVPLRASTNAGVTETTASTVAEDMESQQRGVDSTPDTSNITATCPPVTETDPQYESTQDPDCSLLP